MPKWSALQRWWVGRQAPGAQSTARNLASDTEMKPSVAPAKGHHKREPLLACGQTPLARGCAASARQRQPRTSLGPRAWDCIDHAGGLGQVSGEQHEEVGSGQHVSAGGTRLLWPARTWATLLRHGARVSSGLRHPPLAWWPPCASLARTISHPRPRALGVSARRDAQKRATHECRVSARGVQEPCCPASDCFLPPERHGCFLHPRAGGNNREREVSD